MTVRWANIPVDANMANKAGVKFLNCYTTSQTNTRFLKQKFYYFQKLGENKTDATWVQYND